MASTVGYMLMVWNHQYQVWEPDEKSTGSAWCYGRHVADQTLTQIQMRDAFDANGTTPVPEHERPKRAIARVMLDSPVRGRPGVGRG